MSPPHRHSREITCEEIGARLRGDNIPLAVPAKARTRIAAHAPDLHITAECDNINYEMHVHDKYTKLEAMCPIPLPIPCRPLFRAKIPLPHSSAKSDSSD